MTRAVTAEEEAAALVALVRHNIRPHVQELLVYGSKTQQVTPGALKAALATLTAPPSMTREEAERLVDAFGAVCWDNGRVSHKEGYPAEYAAARAALIDALTRPAGTLSAAGAAASAALPCCSPPCWGRSPRSPRPRRRRRRRPLPSSPPRRR